MRDFLIDCSRDKRSDGEDNPDLGFVLYNHLLALGAKPVDETEHEAKVTL